MKSPGYLVCARATAVTAARDSTFDRKCDNCHQHVMIAPSGQKFLKSKPLGILCAQCFFETAEPETKIELAADPEEVLQEIMSQVPNYYRQRN